MTDYCPKCGSNQIKDTTGGDICLDCGWAEGEIYEYLIDSDKGD